MTSPSPWTAEDRAVLEQVGGRLRAERTRQRYSQNDIAAMIGVYQSSLSKMELGEQNIPLPTYLSWCDALGIDPWELVGWR